MALDEIQKAAESQFGKQRARYGAGHILADVQDVDAARGHIAIPNPARVLDVAAGAGNTGLHLASLGHDVVLADSAAPMLDRVKEAAAARGLSVETRQHPAETLPYAPETFDLVTCRVAPHHFSSPERFVQETSRVLVPGGWLLLIDGTVPDDEPEAEEWLHRVEKLRDPSHNRLLSPRKWQEMCARHALSIEWMEVAPFKQPDLDWYFETASTPAANREEVRRLIATATPRIVAEYKIGEEDGKTVWWWRRLSLVAQKPLIAHSDK